MDDEDFELSTSEYIVRTIRGGRVYATDKIKGVTWVKKSKKHFDWGWSSNVPPWLRRSTDQGVPFYSLYTTKLQGLKVELKRFTSPKYPGMYTDAELIIMIRKIKSAITRARNAKKKF